MQELEGLSDSEAAEHLRSVDEPRVLDVYVFFEYGRNKRSPATLAKMCFALIARSARRASDRHDGARAVAEGHVRQGRVARTGGDSARPSGGPANPGGRVWQPAKYKQEQICGMAQRRAPYQIPPIRTIPQKPDPNQNDVLLQYIEWTFVDFFL